MFVLVLASGLFHFASSYTAINWRVSRTSSATIIHARDAMSEIKNKNKKRVIRMFENPFASYTSYTVRQMNGDRLKRWSIFWGFRWRIVEKTLLKQESFVNDINF